MIHNILELGIECVAVTNSFSLMVLVRIHTWSSAYCFHILHNYYCWVSLTHGTEFYNELKFYSCKESVISSYSGTRVQLPVASRKFVDDNYLFLHVQYYNAACIKIDSVTRQITQSHELFKMHTKHNIILQ